MTYPPNFENYLKALSSLDLGRFNTRSQIDTKLSEHFEEVSFRSFLMQNLKQDGKKNFYWRVNLESLIANAVAISNFPVINVVSNTEALFLYGDLSEYGVKKYKDTIKESFPLSEFAPIAKTGHWVHVEQPIKFLEIVTKFLKSD